MLRKLFFSSKFILPLGIFLLSCALFAEPASAAAHLDGTKLSSLWALPFAGLLLSLALMPLVVGDFWHHHYGKVIFAWIVAFIVPCWISFGSALVLFTVIETVILEYIPFILLLLALFTIAGGIRLTGTLVGTPKLNCLILIIGSALASLMGTTGAAMLLIRPLLRANAHRRYRVHTVVFFIFLVANIGGSLTPLGDPPLFLGFLKGISFFWTTTHLLKEMLFLLLILLFIYFIVDSILYKKEGRPQPDDRGPKEPFGFLGSINFLLLMAVVGLVLLSGLWKSDVYFTVWDGVDISLPALVRNAGFLILTVISLQATSKEVRRGNDFTWEPILEVAKIFIGIFITMAPAIAILKAGPDGALRSLVALASGPDGQPVNSMYFWLTGGLSSFLDNAPTYLVFFNMAGGDPVYLANEIPATLVAISCGAVFMGANTYIGNAPNFMVRSIAVEQGVKMPSFFGYMLWSGAILIPLFVVMTFVFF